MSEESTTVLCGMCVANDALGTPSYARWLGSDGEGYCSMHHIQRFGHAAQLVRIEGYEPPPAIKPPAPKAAKRSEPKREVTA
jgi:hypothetical protein